MTCDELYEFREYNNVYMLTRYLRTGDPGITELEIPSEYRSKPVTTIGDSAFRKAKYLRSVTLPDSVSELGSEIFRDCVELVGVRLPRGICSIPAFAFDGCSSLKSVELPESVTTIFDDAFTDCVSLEEIVLPKNFRSIEGASFSGCTDLRSVVFQSEGVYVCPYAFDDCPALPPETVMRALVPGDDITEPFIPSDEVVFNGCSALRRDVFELAVKYDSFSRIAKISVFRALFSDGLFVEYYPIMSESGWLYREENMTGFGEMLSNIFSGEHCDEPEIWNKMDFWTSDQRLLDGMITERGFAEKLLERSVSLNKTETSARLLEYINNKFGVDGEDNYEL